MPTLGRGSGTVARSAFRSPSWTRRRRSRRSISSTRTRATPAPPIRAGTTTTCTRLAASRARTSGSSTPRRCAPRARGSQNTAMRVSAKADYALRAVLELAAAGEGPVKGEQIAQAQNIPLKFLENILLELRHDGLVASQRGAEGGYWLARAPEEITLAEVIRAVDGPLANVRGARPETVEYSGPAERLKDVWIAVRANLRAVLESVTLADLAAGNLPEEIGAITSDPEAWQPH